MRVIVPVMAAQVGPSNLPSPWPTHIYKSGGCIAMNIGYALATISLQNVLTERLISSGLPVERLHWIWNEYTTSRNALFMSDVPAEVTEEQILAWSAEVVDLYRKVLDDLVPTLRQAIVVPLLAPISSFAAGAILWPLRRIATWTNVQSAREVLTLAQNPVRIFQTMVEAEGSVLRALFGGLHLYGLQCAASLALNFAAYAVASFGISHLENHFRRFMNYQERKRKIYNKASNCAQSVHDSLIGASLATMRVAIPITCFFSTLAFLIAGRAVSMPISLVTTMRILQNSPSLPQQSFVAKFVPRMTDFEIFKEIVTVPARSHLWSWFAWHWKWFMLSAVGSPLGIQISADIELK